MALISIMSAKGAPGATTASMLLANLWPAPSVLVDADPLGGDVALRLGAEHGPLDTERGLMSLLPAARRGLEPHTVLDHAQTARGGQPVVAGLPGPEQAVAVAPLWPGLASAFGRVPGHDVFADLGQVNSRSSHLAMLEHSVALICVYRPTAWSVIHTRRRLEAFEEVLRARQTKVGIVCVASANETRDGRIAGETVTQGLNAWVTDYGTIARDDSAVAMYEGGEVFRPERSLLVRSGREVVARLYADLAAVAAPPTVVEESAQAGPRQRGRRSSGTRRAGERNPSGTAS